MYKVIFARQATKDMQKVRQAGLGGKVRQIVEIVAKNPCQTPPRCEKLLGDLQGYYARRINGQHRFVYEVLPCEDASCQGIVHVLSVWSHYEAL